MSNQIVPSSPGNSQSELPDINTKSNGDDIVVVVVMSSKGCCFVENNKPSSHSKNNNCMPRGDPVEGKGPPLPLQQPNHDKKGVVPTAVNPHHGATAASFGAANFSHASNAASKNPVKSAFRLVQQSWGRLVTVNACDAKDRPKQFRFRYLEVIGNGTFGVVCKAKDMDTEESVAIKTVFQDSHHQNRELTIIKALTNETIVGLKYYYYTRNEYNEEFLSLVLEYMPSSLDKLGASLRTDLRIRTVVKHLLMAVKYLHSRGVCHRDIKPHNVLIDSNLECAKLCDFGCSKRLNPGEPNIQYICARYYRAPEIAFGWPHYTLAIDLWSVGCVMAELYSGKPLFPGKNSVDQLTQIMRVLGPPGQDELAAMGQDPKKFRMTGAIHSQEGRLEGLRTAVGDKVPEDALSLLLGLLQYDPSKRFTAERALMHQYFLQ